MRHLAQMDSAAPANPKSDTAFPKDWFDWSQDKLADLGAMSMLMGVSPYHRGQKVAQQWGGLEPALRLNQYRIFRSKGFPRAFVTWAGLSKTAERHFAVTHLPLLPEHWNSGPSRWVVDLVAPFGHARQILPQMAQSKQMNRMRTLWHNKAGTRARVIEWSRAHPEAEIAVTSYGQKQFEKLLERG